MPLFILGITIKPGPEYTNPGIVYLLLCFITGDQSIVNLNILAFLCYGCCISSVVGNGLHGENMHHITTVPLYLYNCANSASSFL